MKRGVNRQTINEKSINIGPFKGFESFLPVLYTLITNEDWCWSRANLITYKRKLAGIIFYPSLGVGRGRYYIKFCYYILMKPHQVNDFKQKFSKKFSTTFDMTYAMLYHLKDILGWKWVGYFFDLDPNGMFGFAWEYSFFKHKSGFSRNKWLPQCQGKLSPVFMSPKCSNYKPFNASGPISEEIIENTARNQNRTCVWCIKVAKSMKEAFL